VNIKDLFSPPLEINVLHTQSLVRALRIPLKVHGQRNLDKIALEEWRRNERFVEREVKSEMWKTEKGGAEKEKLEKSKVEICLEEATVKMHVKVKLRHVLMFPFLCMVGMAAKGVEMGVRKAEKTKAERVARKKRGKDEEQAKEMEGRMGRSSEGSATTTADTRKQPTRGISPWYRIPKCRRPIVGEAGEEGEEAAVSVERFSEETTSFLDVQHKLPTRGISPSYRIPKRKRSIIEEEEDGDTQPRPKPLPTGDRAMTMPRQRSAPRSVTPSFPSPGYWTTSSSNPVSHPTSYERYDPSRHSGDRGYRNPTPDRRGVAYGRR
jgi:hypothetical protein